MSSGNGRIGVAVVGLGIGLQHAEAYLATGRCDLRWVYDVDHDRARRAADDLNGPRVAESYQQLLNDPRVQLVSIASFDDDHAQQALEAIEAAKHVFVEKPLCRTLTELCAIRDAWSRHEGSVKLSSNLVLRAAPIYRWLKEKIEEGALGEPYAFDGEYLFGRLSKITEGWRKDVEDYSVMLGGGVHLVDLMVWLTGQRPVSVHAVGNRISSRDTAFRYDDYVTATMTCPSGLVCRVTANFGSVHRHQHIVRVYGTRATFLHDDAGPRMHVTRDPTVSACAIDLSTLPEGKGELIGPFVSAVARDDDLRAHTQEIFDTISICVAADTSVARGSEVEVQYA